MACSRVIHRCGQETPTSVVDAKGENYRKVGFLCVVERRESNPRDVSAACRASYVTAPSTRRIPKVASLSQDHRGDRVVVLREMWV